jgi:hypothetical protein
MYQVVSTHGRDSINGTFYLEMGVLRTRHLSYDISADDMKLALLELDGIYDVSIQRSANSLNAGLSWTIAFTNVDVSLSKLYAEGNYLAGSEVGMSVYDFCPSTTSAGIVTSSVAGAVGDAFYGILSGGNAVKVQIDYAESGRYKATYLTPRVGAYN